MKKPVNLLFAIILLAATFQASAQETAPGPQPSPVTVHALLGGALEFGGESVAEVLFTNGDSQKMPAGQGGSLFAGVQFGFTSLPALRVRATAGIKYLTTAADNVHIRLTRFPLTLAVNTLIAKDITFGLGVTTHRSITLKTDGLGQDVTFDASNGLFVELAYKGIGLSYVPMKYNAPNGKTFDASAIGLTLTGVFPRKKN